MVHQNDRSPTSAAVVVIPSRLGSTRLPRKPLALIDGVPMIEHVWRRAVEADIGPVLVACDSPEIADVIKGLGGHVALTNPDHPSGSDRIKEAIDRWDNQNQYDVVLNVQGDLPTISPSSIQACLALLSDENVAVGTIAAEIDNDEDRNNPNIVKVVGSLISDYRMRAIYFTRATAPWGAGKLFHHIGLYAYRRRVLDAFVELPPSYLETRERLEQLRLIEAGFRIDVSLVSDIPLGVDTPEDLRKAEIILKRQIR